MKTWITTKIHNHCDQILEIQPNPEFIGIEIYFSEGDLSNTTNAYYIDKDELPVILKKLQEMMDYVSNK